MKKPLGIFIGLLFATLLALLAWRDAGNKEPLYEGRRLSSWLDHHVASSAARPPYNSPGWRKADEALRAIGTNGIPTLLQMIRAKDPPRLLRFYEIAGRYPWTHLKYRYAVERNEEAEYAFEVLKERAVAAVPGLTKIYEENISFSSQRCAAMALGHIGRGAVSALPALIQRFTHTNAEVRFYAVSAVMEIGGEPGVVIPALTGALRDANVNVRWNALVGLELFGSVARPVVPEILKMLNDPGMVGTSSLTQQVETTLWRIAPETVGNPLLVEDSSPIIEKGVTTQALKMLFNGKRQTLIRPGKPLPVVAQYWNSDPRPRLALYRGAEADNGKEISLGEFEVLGLPESGDLNVSTLCIIADGKIILNARDNHADQFLRIRRVAD